MAGRQAAAALSRSSPGPPSAYAGARAGSPRPATSVDLSAAGDVDAVAVIARAQFEAANIPTFPNVLKGRCAVQHRPRWIASAITARSAKGSGIDSGTPAVCSGTMRMPYGPSSQARFFRSASGTCRAYTTSRCLRAAGRSRIAPASTRLIRPSCVWRLAATCGMAQARIGVPMAKQNRRKSAKKSTSGNQAKVIAQLRKEVDKLAKQRKRVDELSAQIDQLKAAAIATAEQASTLAAEATKSAGAATAGSAGSTPRRGTPRRTVAAPNRQSADGASTAAAGRTRRTAPAKTATPRTARRRTPVAAAGGTVTRRRRTAGSAPANPAATASEPQSASTSADHLPGGL